MLLVAGAVVLAALFGLARRWAAGTSPEAVGRAFTTATIATLVAGAGCAAAGDRWAGRGGLAVLEVGFALIALGAGAAARVRAGFVLIALGVAANFAVVVTNAGMPVRGLPPTAAGAAHHHGLSTHDHLAPLADEIRLLNGYYSPGDVAVAAGAAVAILSAIPRRRTVTNRIPLPASL
jgi:hypothetical protein